MTDLLLISLTGILFITGLSLIKVFGRLSLNSSLVAYRLTFPRNLDVDAVVSAMAGISGLLLPWWRRWLSSPFLSLEIHADRTGIRHYLVVPETWGQSATNILQASLPAVRFEPTDVPGMALRTAAEYRMSSHDRQLNVDAVGLSARLLANLQPLEDRETIVVQWVITPHGPVLPPKISKDKDDTYLASLLGTTADSEMVSAMRKKQAQPLLLAAGRIGVRARTGWREHKLLRTVEAAWHETRAPGVHFRRKSVTNGLVARSMASRRVPFAAWPVTVNSEELSGLIGWPISQVAVPGLVLGGARLIPPSPLVPTSGTVLADSNYPGIERPIAVDVQARLRHTEILGPTGTGKSTLMVSMVLSDLEAGRGVILLDPKGQLVEDLLWRIPENRRTDVIVFDPADRECPVGLNPLRAAHGVNSEVVVENLVGTFKSLYRHSWGPRPDDILRAAILTLADVDGATLCEVSLILNDPTYRRKIVGKIDDPVGLESFWGWYEALSDAERQTVIGPVLNKVRALTMRPTVRSIIGQSTPKLSIPEVMASGKVLLCSLAGGLLGDEAAALLGALIVAEVWHATTARAGRPEASRNPVMAFLDEFQHFIHLPTPMASMLTEARGLGLGLTLAHQHLDQLDSDVRSAVMANARSKVLFQLPSADARLMEREMGGVITADDLQGLGAYEVVCQLFAAGTTQAPATGRTRPLPPQLSDANSLRTSSRSTYGLPREEVERSMRDRQLGFMPSPVGRKSRPGRPS
jgi:hypothetical protein